MLCKTLFALNVFFFKGLSVAFIAMFCYECARDYHLDFPIVRSKAQGEATPFAVRLRV